MACAVCLSVCLSSVTFLHATQRLELFGNIFAPSNSPGTRTLCNKIWGKNSKEFLEIVQVKYKGVLKLAFFKQYLLYFKKRYKHGYSYNRRRIGTRMRCIEWCHFRWPWVTPSLDFKVIIFWTSTNSKMVWDRAIVTNNIKSYMIYWSAPFSMILNNK